MPSSVASSNASGGASYADCFNPAPSPEVQVATAGKEPTPTAPAPSVKQGTPSTPSATDSVGTKVGGDVACAPACVSPSSAASASGSPPASTSPPNLKSSPAPPTAAASIKRIMSESNANAAPSQSMKKTKNLPGLGELRLDSVEGIKSSHRELFGPLSNLPNDPSGQLNEILHRYTVDIVKDWALTATGEAWPKKTRKKEAYLHVSQLVASRLPPANSTPPQAQRLPAVDDSHKKATPASASSAGSDASAASSTPKGGVVPPVTADASSLKQVG